MDLHPWIEEIEIRQGKFLRVSPVKEFKDFIEKKRGVERHGTTSILEENRNMTYRWKIEFDLTSFSGLSFKDSHHTWPKGGH